MKSHYPPRSKQDCGNCFYVEELYRLIGDQQLEMMLQCRRHAPNATHGTITDANWPQVRKENWCGEWAPQEVPE